jgi:ArsR family transcriptional regulator
MAESTFPTDLCCPPLVSAALTETEAAELSGVLKVLSDPSRLRLMSLVASAPGGKSCARDLATPIGKSQPTTSHHLNSLVSAGLLEREQRGRWAWYRISPGRLSALCRVLDPNCCV